MDYTPPTTPIVELDVNKKRGIAGKLPISPITPGLKKFPSERDEITSPTADSLPDIIEKTSFSFLQKDMRDHCISPTYPRFADTEKCLHYLSKRCHGNILTRMLSTSIDFLNDSSQQFKSSRMLGQGSYCFVYEIDSPDDSCNLVVKFPPSKRKSRTILNEGLILSYLHMTDDTFENNHIIPFYGITYLDKSHYRKLRWNESIPALILPKLELNLQQFIKFLKENYHDDIVLKKVLWRKLFNEMIVALNHLKMRRVIHGDIKTANILLGSTGRDDVFSFDNFNYYLCDFTSSIVDVSDDVNLRLEDMASTKPNNFNLDTTLEYCPPEIIETVVAQPGNENSGSNDCKPILSSTADLYSFGLCLLSFICEDEPYHQLKSYKFHGGGTYMPSGSMPSSVQHTQWLINSILKNDPIALNTFTDQNDYYSSHWSQELGIVSKILVDRITLEECVSQLY